MGGSKSSSKQSQSTSNFDDSRYVNLESGGSLTVLDLSNIGSIGTGNTIKLEQQGIAGTEVKQLVESFGMQIGKTLEANNAIQADTRQTLSQLATSATGSDTETGRLIGKLALPLALVAIAWFWFTTRK